MLVISVHRFFFSLIALALCFCGCDSKSTEPISTPNTKFVSTALDLVSKGEYRQALPHLKNYVDQVTVRSVDNGLIQLEDSTPNDLGLHPTEVVHLLAFVYEKVGESEKALGYYLLATDSKNLLVDYALHHQAKLYNQQDYQEESVLAYNRLIQDYPVYPRSITAEFQLAKIYLQNNDFSALMPRLEKLKEKSTTTDQRRANLLIAESLVKQSKWKEAYQVCSQLIAKKSSDWVAWEALSQISRIRRSVKTISPNSDQLMHQAMVYYHNRHFTRCRSILRSIIKKSGQNQKLSGHAAYQIGYSFYRQRQYSNAIHWFRKVINTYSSSDYLTRAYYRLTVCYRRKGFTTRAEVNLKIFIKKYQWSQLRPDALYDLGRIYERKKQYSDAIHCYQQLVDNHQQSRLVQRTYWQMGWSQFKSNLWMDCLKTFDILQDKYPNDTYALVAEYWKAKCYLRMDKKTLAETNFRRVAQKKRWYYSDLATQQLSNSKITRLNSYDNSLAWLELDKKKSIRVERLMRFGMLEDAIAELESDLHSSDKMEQINHTYNLMVCHQKLGNYQTAYSYANRLKSFPQLKNDNGQLPIQLYKTLYPFHYADEIIENAKDYNIDPLFVAAMIREESRYNAEVVSPAGARGLMQVMVPTGKAIAKEIKFPDFKGEMLFNPKINIQFGTWYMSDLMRRFNNNCSLVAGAYNGGPNRIKGWLQKAKPEKVTNLSPTSIISQIDIDEFVENIPIDETRRHIKKVMDSYSIYRYLYGKVIDDFEMKKPDLSITPELSYKQKRTTKTRRENYEY